MSARCPSSGSGRAWCGPRSTGRRMSSGSADARTAGDPMSAPPPRLLRALLSPLAGRVRALVRGSDHAPVGVPLETVREVVARHGVQSWFVYAFESWKARPEPRETCRWLCRRVPKDAAIFEAGGGIGVNLLWFHHRGWSRLYGLDVDASTIAAGEELGRRAGASLVLWTDDGLSPTRLTGAPYGAVLVLSWSFLLDDIDLTSLVATYAGALAPGGYLAIEL